MELWEEMEVVMSMYTEVTERGERQLCDCRNENKEGSGCPAINESSVQKVSR